MKRIYQIEQLARHASEKYERVDIFEDRSDEDFIIQKVFNKGKLIAHNIYEINKLTRL